MIIYIILTPVDVLSKDKISLPIQYIPENLNPALCNDTGCQFILNNIADGLVGWNFDEGLFPEVAKSWSEVSGGELIFYLREDLKSFGGKPMSCKEIKVILDQFIKSDGPFNSSFKKITKIECISKSKLQISSTMNSKELLKFMAGPQTKILKANSRKIEDGVGPFNIEVFNNKIILKKNEYYYGKEKIFLNSIELSVTPDVDALRIYENNGFDMVILSNLSGFDLKKKFSSDELRHINLWSTWGIAFNQNIYPYKDKSFRECLISSVSSEEWISEFYPMNLPAYGPVPFGMLGHTEKRINLKTLNTKKFSYTFEVVIPKEIERSHDISNWLMTKFSNCAYVKNIKITVKPFDNMMKLFNERKLPAFLMSFNKESISDEQYYKSFYEDGIENFYSNFSRETRELLSNIDHDNSANLKNINKAIGERLSKDALMIPLMHPIHRSIIKKCIKGVVLNPINEGYFFIRNARNLCN